MDQKDRAKNFLNRDVDIVARYKQKRTMVIVAENPDTDRVGYPDI